jgi:hypothetical protein
MDTIPTDYNGETGADMLARFGFEKNMQNPSEMVFRRTWHRGGHFRDLTAMVIVRDANPAEVRKPVDEQTRLYEAFVPKNSRWDFNGSGYSFVTSDVRNIIALAVNELNMISDKIEPMMQFQTQEGPVASPFCDAHGHYFCHPATVPVDTSDWHQAPKQAEAVNDDEPVEQLARWHQPSFVHGRDADEEPMSQPGWVLPGRRTLAHPADTYGDDYCAWRDGLCSHLLRDDPVTAPAMRR